MNPSDTHIERMAETFAERSFPRRPHREGVRAWKEALEIGREQGLLEQMEQNMLRRKLADLPVRDAWQRAREY